MSENGENVHYNFSQLNATSSDEEPKDILFAICAKKRIKSSNLRRNLEPLIIVWALVASALSVTQCVSSPLSLYVRLTVVVGAVVSLIFDSTIRSCLSICRCSESQHWAESEGGVEGMTTFHDNQTSATATVLVKPQNRRELVEWGRTVGHILCSKLSHQSVSC